MESGTLSREETGPIDLQSTVESGQTFRWTRANGQTYDRSTTDSDGSWYTTVVRPREDRPSGSTTERREPDVIRVRQVEEALEWEASFDAEATLSRRLGLEDDLEAIRAATPDDPIVATAFDRYWGMRVVRDSPFETLISFICSAQMRIPRIYEMVQTLAREFGETVTFGGEQYHAFPTPPELAATTEAELRELGLGYRAPYVQRTAEMVASGDAHPTDAMGLPYEDARESLTQFVGVGEKVADCLLLFSLGYFEAVPLDTWMRTMIEEYFPDCERGSYAETSRAIRERLGGEYAGYAQTYVFHHLRNENE